MKVGFVGLGVMGIPMAGHLLKGGHALYLNTKRKVPDALIAAGGIACATPAEVAKAADVAIAMVPATADVEKVLFGPDGIASGLSAGKVFVDMSSISPIETKVFAQRMNDLGVHYLDAAVSGGEVGAKAASLSIRSVVAKTSLSA